MAKKQKDVSDITLKEKKKKRKEKKEVRKKHFSYLREVGSELKKVSFPSFKDVLKYTLATILFCGILVLFFVFLNLLLSWVKGMF